MSFKFLPPRNRQNLKSQNLENTLKPLKTDFRLEALQRVQNAAACLVHQLS